MKKILALALTAVLALMSLAACGSKKKDDDTAPPDTQEAQSGDEITGLTYEEGRSYDYDLSEYITLPDHKAPHLTCDIITVTDNDVEVILEQALEDAGTSQSVTGRGAAAGDKVTYDTSGTRADDGTQFEQGSGRTVVIGGEAYLDGFTENFLGAVKGQSFSFNYTFPDDYYRSEMAGVAVVYNVTVTAVELVTPAVLDDAFAASQNIEGVSTADEYRAYLRAGLEETAAGNNEQTLRNAVQNLLTEGARVIKWPEKEYGYYSDLCDKNCSAYAKTSGITADAYITQTYGSREKYDEYVRGYAEEHMLTDMIMWSLAREYGVTVTDEEYEEELRYGFENYGSNYGFTELSEFERAFSANLTYGLLLKNSLDAVVAVSTVN